MDSLKEIQEHLKSLIAEKQHDIVVLNGEISGLYSALNKVENVIYTIEKK